MPMVSFQVCRLAAMLAMLVLAAMPARAQQVDFHMVYDLAKRSAAAYEKPRDIREQYPAAVRIAKPGNAQVLYFLEVDHARRRQVLTVRGSANQTNMDEDMDTHEAFDARLGVRVHAGFDRVSQVLYDDLAQHLVPGYATFLTGHSLGGAVAGVLSGYLSRDGHSIAGVITFGQPKFTNVEGVRAYASIPLLRITYQNDVVPMLPSATADPKHGAYAHAGPELVVLQGPYYSWLYAGVATARSVKEFEDYAATASLPDHHIHFYLAGIQAKLNGATPVPFGQRRKYITRHRPAGTFDPGSDHR